MKQHRLIVIAVQALLGLGLAAGCEDSSGTKAAATSADAAAATDGTSSANTNPATDTVAATDVAATGDVAVTGKTGFKGTGHWHGQPFALDCDFTKDAALMSDLFDDGATVKQAMVRCSDQAPDEKDRIYVELYVRGGTTAPQPGSFATTSCADGGAMKQGSTTVEVYFYQGATTTARPCDQGLTVQSLKVDVAAVDVAKKLLKATLSGTFGGAKGAHDFSASVSVDQYVAPPSATKPADPTAFYGQYDNCESLMPLKKDAAPLAKGKLLVKVNGQQVGPWIGGVQGTGTNRRLVACFDKDDNAKADFVFTLELGSDGKPVVDINAAATTGATYEAKGAGTYYAKVDDWLNLFKAPAIPNAAFANRLIGTLAVAQFDATAKAIKVKGTLEIADKTGAKKSGIPVEVDVDASW